MAIETASPIVRLSKKRLEALIDREAQRRLHISGQEFRRRLLAGTLRPESVAVRDIAMLVKLVSNGNPRSRYSHIR